MPITIRGIRITSLEVSRSEEGKDKIKASYQLVASNDKVLAKENLSSEADYTGQLFTPSPQTIKALTDAVALYKKDVEMSIGFSDE